MFYFGAQYYRPPNPKPEDWERDLENMNELGFNILKIWAMWTHIHIAEDRYDFSDFDRLMDLSAKKNLKVVISVILENAPYWLAVKHPESRYEAHDGLKIDLIARPNTPGGGWPGMCFDNECIRKPAEDFMRTMAERYRNHPALYGYDIWDEAFFEVNDYFGNRRFCYCEGTARRFRNWLKEKYQSVENLSREWCRRYTAWEEVFPPRFFGGYPDWIDWLKFRLETHHALMRWRADCMAVENRRYVILSHGVAGILGMLPTYYNDDWKNAETVEQWGLSTFPDWTPRKDLCDHMILNDITRCSAKGKTVWQNELQGGRVTACGKGEEPHGLQWDTVPGTKDYLFWNWTSLMCGCKGVMYWQWRNEVLGPESPGFGLTGFSGDVNERTEAAASFARFVLSHQELEQAVPLTGDLAIAVFNESQFFNYAAEGGTEYYTDSLRGFYRALWEDNFQVDFASPDDFEKYPCIYVPFPLMLEKASACRMTEFVNSGGIVISEGCPAHFLEHGYCSSVLPGQGLHNLFGVTSDRVDSFKNSFFVWNKQKIPAGIHQQKIKIVSAKKLAGYPDSSPAVTVNNYGKGKAVVIGTYPGMTYCRTGDKRISDFLKGLIRLLGISPLVSSNDSNVKARFHRGNAGDYLYVLNCGRQQKKTMLEISKKAGFYRKMAEINLSGEPLSSLQAKNRVDVKVGSRSGTILKLFR